MTNQPTMFGFADTRTRQPVLFDTDGPPALTAKCQRCGAYLKRTPSNYQTCPRGCGKLVEPMHCPIHGVTDSPVCRLFTEPESAVDDESLPAWDWPEQARRIAKKHARLDNWHGRRWSCKCGACTRARLDGFIPRERIEH
jgi:hypothetical protein